MKRLKKFRILTIPISNLTTILPAIVGILYAAKYYHQFNFWYSFLFCIATVIFLMAANAINECHGNWNGKTYVIQNIKMSRGYVFGLIAILLAFTVLIGIYLVYQTGLPLLWMGLISFAFGFIYTMTIKLPVGDSIIGLIIGYMVPLMAAYVNIHTKINFTALLLKTFLVSVPIILSVANISLAKSIRDQKLNESLGIKHLVSYIGLDKTLKNWRNNYIIAYLFIILDIFIKVLPWQVAVVILTYWFSRENVRIFMKHPNSMRNSGSIFVVITMSLIIGLAVSLWI